MDFLLWLCLLGQYLTLKDTNKMKLSWKREEKRFFPHLMTVYFTTSFFNWKHKISAQGQKPSILILGRSLVPLAKVQALLALIMCCEMISFIIAVYVFFPMYSFLKLLHRNTFLFNHFNFYLKIRRFKTTNSKKGTL